VCGAVCGARESERARVRGNARARETDLAFSKKILGVQVDLCTFFFGWTGLDYSIATVKDLVQRGVDIISDERMAWVSKTILNINVRGLGTIEGKGSSETGKRDKVMGRPYQGEGCNYVHTVQCRQQRIGDNISKKKNVHSLSLPHKKTSTHPSIQIQI